MKIKKLFEDYNKFLKKHRTVEIINVGGFQVYFGSISNIPENIAEREFVSWSTVMDVERPFKNRCDADICDEDREMAGITMYVSIVVD